VISASGTASGGTGREGPLPAIPGRKVTGFALMVHDGNRHNIEKRHLLMSFFNMGLEIKVQDLKFGFRQYINIFYGS